MHIIYIYIYIYIYIFIAGIRRFLLTLYIIHFLYLVDSKICAHNLSITYQFNSFPNQQKSTHSKKKINMYVTTLLLANKITD